MGSSEAFEAGEDAGGGDGHARLGDAHLLDEKADGGHEGVVVEEGLAHAHEDQVDAIFADLNDVAIQHGGDLAGDLAGGEVAAHAQLGGEAELAVDRAADLAGDADGGAFVACRDVRLGVFRAVAIGHPDGLDGLAIGQADEVAFGAVDGLCRLRQLR